VRLTGLADALRRWKLDVEEVPGWEKLGKDFPSMPEVVLAHHTGTPATAKGDYPSLNVVRNGRSDLPGPLSQVGIGRSGKVYVIAAGKCNHAGEGSWLGINVGNYKSVGIEAESPGGGEWTAEQRRVYPIVCAALCELLDTPATHVAGHRETALPLGRKPDPRGIDLVKLRAKVAALLAAGPEPEPTPPAPPVEQEDEEVALYIVKVGSGKFLTDLLSFRRPIRNTTIEKSLTALGIKNAAVDEAFTSKIPLATELKPTPTP
jgi:hypothetical protein